MADESERQEYVLNENGIIFVGNANYIEARGWYYGQVSVKVLLLAFKAPALLLALYLWAMGLWPYISGIGVPPPLPGGQQRCPCSLKMERWPGEEVMVREGRQHFPLPGSSERWKHSWEDKQSK